MFTLRRSAAMLLLLGLLPACGAAGDDTVAVKSGQPIDATLTLLPAGDGVGRSGPISDGYAPQIAFKDAGEAVSCAVHMKDAPQIAPGASAPVTLVCAGDVKLRKTQPQFEMTEGGKKVGQGAVVIP